MRGIGKPAWFSTTLLLVTVFPNTANSLTQDHVNRLVAVLTSASGEERIAASRELLQSAQPAQLVTAGAKPARGLSPTRLDILYSLMQGFAGRYLPDSFGLHLDAGTTREDAEQLGRRHGVIISQWFGQGTPTCYVRLENGKKLETVLRDLLLTEPRVVSLNLNYYVH